MQIYHELLKQYMTDHTSISSTSMRSPLEDAIDGTLTHRTAFMNHDVSGRKDVVVHNDISEVVTDIVDHESGNVDR